MGGGVILSILGLIRVATLTSERVALHELGKSRDGTLPTMGIGFGGAALILWVMAFFQGNTVWVSATLWAGFIYALAFGLYTFSLTTGQLSVVSPWSNATVLMLWMMHPEGNALSILGVTCFAGGVLLSIRRDLSLPVVWMLLSDGLLASARFLDMGQIDQSPSTYAACLFTVISLWMLLPIVLFRRTRALFQLISHKPGWSFIAATSNAAAYLTLFILLRFVHPASVEAISALASSAATLCGIYFFHEKQGLRKFVTSSLMTAGSILLLIEH
jgi:drug/metabolite transporter (DMT)-like permease